MRALRAGGTPTLAILVVALLAASAAASPRLQLAGELELGVGYNDNLFLNPEIPGTTSLPIADGLLHLEPRVFASAIANGHTLLLGYDLLWHQTASYGSVSDHLATLEYRTPSLGPLSVRLAALIERYDAPYTSVGAVTDFDAFWFAAFEGSIAATGALGHAVLSYRPGYRSYPNRIQTDDDQRLLLLLERRLAPSLSAGASYNLMWVPASTDPDIDDLRRYRFALFALYEAFPLSVRVEPMVAIQTLPHFVRMSGQIGRRDTLVGVDAQATLRIRDSVDLFARYDYFHSASDDATGQFSRAQLIAGLSLHAATETGSALVGQAAAEQEAREEMVPRVGPGGRVRFRVRAPGAGRVAVVGDWNGWDDSAGVMTAVPGQPALFERELTLPAGRHAYAFLVDGRPSLPEGAESYVSDGFGGRNGILTVPEPVYP